jgi:ribosomal protein L37AE/L43A
MIDETSEPQCKLCGDSYDARRYNIGFVFCLPCGDEIAFSVKRTVVPMHKSNLVMITNRDDLIGINNKGGLVR